MLDCWSVYLNIELTWRYLYGIRITNADFHFASVGNQFYNAAIAALLASLHHLTLSIAIISWWRRWPKYVTMNFEILEGDCMCVNIAQQLGFMEGNYTINKRALLCPPRLINGSATNHLR